MPSSDTPARSVTPAFASTSKVVIEQLLNSILVSFSSGLDLLGGTRHPQGIGQLFPWNVFINAEDYFRRRFCDTSFERSFENSFALGYNIAAILGMLAALRYQEGWNLRLRIIGSLLLSVLAFVVCGALVLAEGVHGTFLFLSTMLSVVASGVAVAFLQGGLFSMASAFPPRYTQAMMAGQGLAGLVVALAGLFTNLAGPDDQSCIVDADESLASSARTTRAVEGRLCAAYRTDWSTLVYFCIAVAVLLACMLSYPVLERLPVTTFYTRSVGNDGHGGETSDICDVTNVNESDDEVSNGSTWLTGSRSPVDPTDSPGSSMYRRLVEAPPLRVLPADKLLSEAVPKPREGTSGADGGINVDQSLLEATGNRGQRYKLGLIAPDAFAVFFVFTVTLSVFPGATSQIVSSRQCLPGRSRFFATDVFVLFSFVSFNTFDFLGRLAAGLSVVLPAAWLPTASATRLVFVPLLLACRSEHSRFRNWLSADFFPLAIMPAFAFTNGYVGSLSMMVGSQKGAWAGTAMVLFLNGGLLAGALLSFVVLYLSTEAR